VGFPGAFAGQGVDVEDAQVAVVGARDHPLAAGNEGRGPDGQVRDLP
jgi:hypothetical protein